MTAFDTFLLGVICKTLATLVTYPYILAKTRLQSQSLSVKGGKSDKLTGVKGSAWRLLAEVLSREGVVGLFRGIEAQIVKAVLSQALLFVIKDSVMDYTLRLVAAVPVPAKQ